MYTTTSPAHRVARELESDTALVKSVSYDSSAPSLCMPAEATLYLTDGAVAVLSDTSCVDDIGFSAFVIHRGGVSLGTRDVRFRYPVMGEKFDGVVSEMKQVLEDMAA